MNLEILGIGSLVKSIGDIAGDLITTDKERLQIALQEKQIDADLDKAQMAVNAAEAANPHLFVAGWRPAIGWIGAAAMAYQFLLYPLLTWGWALMQAQHWIPAALAAPPVLPADQLWVVLSGMLGIAGLRSYDKRQGTQTDQLGGGAKR